MEEEVQVGGRGESRRGGFPVWAKHELWYGVRGGHERRIWKEVNS